MTNTDDDWELLAGLLLDGGSAFRHRMGLRRAGGHGFYAPTEAAGVIRAEKEQILHGPAGDLYLLTSEIGRTALQEFADLLGMPLGESSSVAEFPGDRETARAFTLRLEPDLLLLAAPDWELVWASVCFPTRWSLEDKLHRPLGEIHGVVPGLNAELGRKVAVFLERLPPTSEGWARANWGLTTSDWWDQHPRLPLAPIRADTPPTETFLRVESQHFCRLTVTGAVAFGIRIVNFAVGEVLARGDLREALREQLRTMPAAVATYKGIPPGWWQGL